MSEEERRIFGEYLRYLHNQYREKHDNIASWPRPNLDLKIIAEAAGVARTTLVNLRDGNKQKPEGAQYVFSDETIGKLDALVDRYLQERDEETEFLDFEEWLENRLKEKFTGSTGANSGNDEELQNAESPEDEEGQSTNRADAEQQKIEPPQEAPPDTRTALTRSLEGFLTTADKILLFPPFSWQALSIHFCFAAFYAFLAMALVWGLSSALDLGAVAILPSGSEVATTGRDFAGQDVSNNRFFVLSVVLVVVLVVVVGLIAAYTSITSAFAQKLVEWVRKRADQLAIGAIIISAVAIGVSGMDARFAVLFGVIMVVAVLLAGRWDRRRLLAFSFPYAFIFSITCIVVIGNTSKEQVYAAGGVLPVLAFLTLLIGAAAQSKDENGELVPSGDGTLISAGVVLACSLLLAGLNFFVFDGWFRIDPWDPGTVVVFLILPIANGIWDFFSASITRRLSQWALDVTKAMEDHKAVLAYIGFVLVDVIFAFGTIILLYLCLFGFLTGYNMIAFPDSEGVNLNAFFAGFQDSLFSANGILVIIMLVTVLVPTLIHVHMVSRSMLRVGGLVGNLSALGYLCAMFGCLALLLNAARGILHFLVPAVPV